MGINASLSKWSKAAGGLLRLVARPVGAARSRRGLVLEPYRGYGSKGEVFLIGRVLRQSASARAVDEDTLAGQIADTLRRAFRHAVPGVVVTARFYGVEERVVTDADGYFRVHLSPGEVPAAETEWHPMDLSVEAPAPVRAQGRVYIPPDHCRFVVISDIDDTVMKTGVANKAKMLWRLFVEDAENRIAFPGVAALYRALHVGESGRDANPMLYVSRAPWGIYAVLEEFFHLHGIPVGPILFLREWGISWTSPLPRKAEDHKLDLIRNMLNLYDGLPFVMIGDSGQHDPEVYRRIVEEHPGRVLAVYIRNVSRSRERVARIEELAIAVASAGSSLLLAADSAAMAAHAAKLGLVSGDTVEAVRAELAAQAQPAGSAHVDKLRRPTGDATAQAVAEGELKTMIDKGEGATPPNVLVEAAGPPRTPPKTPPDPAERANRPAGPTAPTDAAQ